MNEVASFRASLTVNRDMQSESMHSRTSVAKREEASISLRARAKVFLIQMVAHLSLSFSLSPSPRLTSALCVSISTASFRGRWPLFTTFEYFNYMLTILKKVIHTS